MKKFLVLLVTGLMVMGFAMTASAGEYYMYADFTSADGFRGGYDVDSYGDYLYVNRNGTEIDRYTVITEAETATQDVNTHPDNVGPDGTSGSVPGDTDDDNQGTMLTRTLRWDTSYTVPAIGGASVSEIYATATGLYFLDNVDAISYYDFSSATTTSGITTSLLGAADTWGEGSLLARDGSDAWYVGGEFNDIYKYNDVTDLWEKIIDHIVSPGGGHLDGLEIVSLDVTDDDVDNAEEWIFAADMTSNYMQRYSLAGVWQEQYTYSDLAGLSLEGMGFGANNHFWATGSSHLYEIGGGAFENVEPPDNPVPEPATMLLFGLGLLGLAGINRRKRV